MLLFACVDSHKGDMKRNNNVHSNLCVMTKTNAQSEIPLFEEADADLSFW